MNDSKPRTTKAGTTAERVVWMTRTSDVLGSHLRTDLESYLTLIRRKIQEKCSTTAELITQIRRYKVGESGHVTPNEFRFTLIKFGIILPQVLVDRIFNVFDSDRSGTMDFDEFAMWIMNSEFRPAMADDNKKPEVERENPDLTLRKKLVKCIKEHPKVFSNMKKQVSFLEFISDVNRAHMPINDVEARAIFQLLDPHDHGFIESVLFTVFADSGQTEYKPKPAQKDRRDPTEEEIRVLMARAVGRNTRQLEKAFSHIKLGNGTKLPFEEFRRCLLNGGSGKNLQDIRELFMALGGSNTGLADVDFFFKILPPIIVDPNTEVSVKPTAPPGVSTSRADRRLRDSIRKCYKEVRHDIEREDSTASGYISAEKMYRILVKRCMPLTFEDFRFVVQQIRKEPGTDRIDYQHFLHGYNPLIPPHQLDGLATLKRYGNGQGSTGTLNNSIEFGKSSDNFGNTLPTATSGSSMRLNSISPATSLTPKAVDDINLRPSNATGTFNDTSNLSSSQEFSLPGSTNNPELKRIWQGVLRECHRADPERAGQINRIAFINALERSNLSNGMSAEAMNKLADNYTLSNGLINYLLLFRNFLNGLTNKTSSSTTSLATSLDLSSSTQNLTLTKSHDSGPIHPWEFGYKRERKSEHPYWQQATSVPKEQEANQALLTLSTFKPQHSGAFSDKEMEHFNPKEKEILLSQYQSSVVELCNKVYQMLARNWRDVRAQFKKQQINNDRGSILATHFVTILEQNGINLTKKELGVIVKTFRVNSTSQDMVKFDEFLRVCLMTKS